jgi:hypothetical protein
MAKPKAEVSFYKLTTECRICMRLYCNRGNCSGRSGLVNICLGFKEDKIAELRLNKKTDENNIGVSFETESI